MNSENLEKPNNLAKIPRVRQRREEVMGLLLSGWSRAQIIGHQKKQWNAGGKTTDKDIEFAYKTIRTNHNIEYSELISRHIAMYYELFNKAEEMGDTKGAIASLQSVEKLLKLHNSDNSTFVQNNSYSFDNLSLEEAKQLLLDSKQDD